MLCINKNCAIALFDSGVGGVTIMREIHALMPCEDIIYYADSANCPYGGKSADEIVKLSEAVVELLLTKEVKIIVVACNTATTNAILSLRSRYPSIKFVGTEPAVKPAVTRSSRGIVGVLATRSTISSHQIANLTRRYGAGKVVLEQSGDGLVELVENGLEDSEAAVSLLTKYIAPMLAQGIDYLALGCTHYPFLLNSIDKVIEGYDVTVINPAPAIAKRVRELLAADGLLNDCQREAKITFFSSSEDEEYIEKLKNRYNRYNYGGKSEKK